MSWFETLSRMTARHVGLMRLAVGGMLALALSGCLQPMYGNLSAGGPGLQDELQRIAIEPIGGRIGHYLGDDLIFALNGTGSHPLPKYRLFVTVTEGVYTPLVDTVSGYSTSGTMAIYANYRLVRLDTNAEVTKGRAFVFKSYDRNSDRFSNIRAARDAEIRNAEQLADDLRTRLSTFLSEHPQS